MGVWRGPAQEPHTAGSAHRHHQAHPPRWKSGKVSSCLASPALMGMPGGWEERNEWDTACFGVQLGLVSTDLLGWRSGGGLKNQLQVWGEFSPPDAVSRQETVSEPSSLLPQELVFFWGAESRLPPAPHLQTCFRDPASSKNHHRDDANGTSRSWVPAKHTSGQALPGGVPPKGQLGQRLREAPHSGLLSATSSRVTERKWRPHSRAFGLHSRAQVCVDKVCPEPFPLRWC